MCVDSFIGNDTNLSDNEESSRFHIVTGPNSSGKSVYLKQIGLLVHLAQIGSFVPAEHAELPLFDGIFCRFDRNLSSSIQLSSFANDCCEMSYILKNCSGQSLVLLDEFGKGTRKEHGIALLTGIIRHFDGLGNSMPTIVMTSHFHEIFSLNLVSLSLNRSVQFFQMSFVQKDERSSERSGLVHLFKLKPGLCTSSFGLHCAKSAGISMKTLKRTHKIASGLSNRKPIKPLHTLKSESEQRKRHELLTALYDINRSSLPQFRQLLSTSHQSSHQS